MKRYDDNKYTIFASHFVNGENPENELFAGFLSHINDPSPLKYDEYLDRCTITIAIRGIAKYKDTFLQNFTLRPGMIIFRPQGSIYSFERFNVGKGYLEYVINLPENFAQTFYDSKMLPRKSEVHKLSLDDNLIQRLINLSETLNRVNKNYLGEYMITLSDLLDYIHHSIFNEQEDQDAKLLLYACRVLENDLDKIINLDDLAKKLGICQRKLRYLFSNNLNISPQQYRMRYKFIYAKNLLINSTKTIKEISIALGYSNQHNFSRQFREFYDMSPEHFRKKEFQK